MAADENRELRVDKWLWAARFFKTRANATRAVTGGKVHLNGTRIKPAHGVRVGDTLRIRRDNFEFTLIVARLAARRGPASEAQTLYEEAATSIAQRAELAATLRAARAAGVRRPRRPDKRTRRQLREIRMGLGSPEPRRKRS